MTETLTHKAEDGRTLDMLDGVVDRITKAADDAKLGMVELSKKSGASYTALRDVLKGQSKPSLRLVAGIAIATGVSLDYLAFGTTDS